MHIASFTTYIPHKYMYYFDQALNTQPIQKYKNLVCVMQKGSLQNLMKKALRGDDNTALVVVRWSQNF